MIFSILLCAAIGEEKKSWCFDDLNCIKIIIFYYCRRISSPSMFDGFFLFFLCCFSLSFKNYGDTHIISRLTIAWIDHHHNLSSSFIWKIIFIAWQTYFRLTSGKLGLKQKHFWRWRLAWLCMCMCVRELYRGTAILCLLLVIYLIIVVLCV